MYSSRARLAVLITLILLGSVLLYAASLPLESSRNTDGSVVVTIKKDYINKLYEILGLGEPSPYVLWATLTLPRTGILLPAEAKIVKGDLYFKFEDKLILDYLSKNDNSAAFPTIHIVMADYTNNKIINIDISSLTLAEIESILIKNKRLSINERLNYNKYKFLIFEKDIILNSVNAPIMLSIGDVIVKDMPDVPSIEEILNITETEIAPNSCPPGEPTEWFSYSIVRSVNENIVELMGVEPPDWWVDRYIEVDGDPWTNATWAWRRYVVDLLASTYYIDVEYFGSIEQGLSYLTQVLLHRNLERVNRTDGSFLWLNAVYMESFVLDDHWNSSLTGDAGFIEVDPKIAKKLRVRISQVSLEASPAVVERDPAVALHGIYSYVRGSAGTIGIMVSGIFFAMEEQLQTKNGSNIIIIGPNSTNSTFSLYANLSSLVYGPDAIIVWWKVIPERICDRYFPVKPVTLLTPLYMVELNYSTLAFERSSDNYTWTPPPSSFGDQIVKDNIIINESTPRYSLIWKWNTMIVQNNLTSSFDAVCDIPPALAILASLAGGVTGGAISFIISIATTLSSIGTGKISDDASFFIFMLYMTLYEELDGEYDIIIIFYPTKHREFALSSSNLQLLAFPSKVKILMNYNDYEPPPDDTPPCNGPWCSMQNNDDNGGSTQ